MVLLFCVWTISGLFNSPTPNNLVNFDPNNTALIGLPVEDFNLADLHNSSGAEADRLGFTKMSDFFAYNKTHFVFVRVIEAEQWTEKNRYGISGYKAELQTSTLHILSTLWSDRELPDTISVTQSKFGGCCADEETNLLRVGGVYMLPLSYWAEDDTWYINGDLDVLFEIDDQSHLYYAKARYYDLMTARMLSEDPIQDGLNWYVYCYNNPLRYSDLGGLKPGDPFETPDDDAVDFATEYNQTSIEAKREYGAVIYEVTVCKKKTVVKRFLLWTWKKEVDDETKIEETYYTYSEPIEGTKIKSSNDFNASVKASKAPKGTVEVAQIHTHSCYVNVRYFKKGQDYIIRGEVGFSPEDIKIAKKRGVDTYMVDYYGNLYKASHDKSYDDKNIVYKTGFYVDPGIEMQKGMLLDLRDDPSIW